MHAFQIAAGLLLFFGGAVFMGIGATIFMADPTAFAAFMNYREAPKPAPEAPKP
jgi:hypothetical protein